MWLTTVTVWLFSREGVAKSPCKCGSGSGIYTAGESTAKKALVIFEDQYPDVLQEDNLEDILSHLMEQQ